jgi:hypothetical protein
MAMPAKVEPTPAPSSVRPSQLSLFATVARHSPLTIGATSSTRNCGSTRMSLFRNTSTRAPAAARAPALHAAAKPWFRSNATSCTSPRAPRNRETVPSDEPLSTTTIRRRAAS